MGVARQYCGRLGKQDNCQVAVSLSVANHTASLPIAYQLYLPEEWAGDAARRAKAHVPENVAFQTKPEIALKQIKAALEAGDSRGRRAGGRGLWRRCEVSLWPYGARSRLCRRSAIHAERLASRDGALAAAAVGRTRADADAIAPGQRASARFGEAVGDEFAVRCMERGDLARGNE